MAMTPEQERKLNDIHLAVVGDESLGHVGLVKRMTTVERWVMGILTAGCAVLVGLVIKHIVNNINI